MQIDIKHLAKLSRLKTTDDEEEKFEIQMQSIIKMVEKLPEIKEEDSLLDIKNPMICRKDLIANNFKRDEILSNAPKTQAGCVVVPKIIE